MKVYEFPEHNLKVTEKLRFPWQIANTVTNKRNVFKMVFCDGKDEQVAFQLICFKQGISWSNGDRKFYGVSNEAITAFSLHQLPEYDKIYLTFQYTQVNANAFNRDGYENIPRCNFSDYWEVEKLN